jgi:hypothetical protein
VINSHNNGGGLLSGGPHYTMKILHSKKKVKGFEHKVFSLNEVYWKLDEAAILDRKFREALSKSLKEHGMLWPPVVWKQETFLVYLQEGKKKHDPSKAIDIDLDYRVAIGNNRFYYAEQNGYTHIECVLAPAWQDRDTISAQTLMEYRKDY